MNNPVVLVRFKRYIYSLLVAYSVVTIFIFEYVRLLTMLTSDTMSMLAMSMFIPTPTGAPAIPQMVRNVIYCNTI